MSNSNEKLCLACGLCCNGVIFADVQLQPTDDAKKLEALGLKLIFSGKNLRRGGESAPPIRAKFLQPCAALQGCTCEIYTERPRYCRQFECALLQKVSAGETSMTEALRTVQQALRRVEKVKNLLRALGDTNEEIALRKRFQRVQMRFELGANSDKANELFADLSNAMHELNISLSENFYPGTDQKD